VIGQSVRAVEAVVGASFGELVSCCFSQEGRRRTANKIGSETLPIRPGARLSSHDVRDRFIS
jgi:hypothetical protein